MVERDLIFDIGMHRGEDTDFYLRKGYRVVGVEADPDNAAFCRKRFADQIARGQVTVVEGAVTLTGAPPKIRFFKNIDFDFWGTVDPSFVRRNRRKGARSREIEVHTVDLCTVFEEHGCPWYLKSDIQGSDWIVLQALEAAADRPPLVSLNAEKVSFDKLVAEVDSLVRLGYRSLQVVQQGSIWKSVVETTALAGTKFRYEFERGASGVFGEDLPDRWVNRDALLRQYLQIFREYRWFGDNSMLVRYEYLMSVLSRLIGRPLPGWHDIHACLYPAVDRSSLKRLGTRSLAAGAVREGVEVV
jgi:FkbM family methyltransferase